MLASPGVSAPQDGEWDSGGADEIENQCPGKASKFLLLTYLQSQIIMVRWSSSQHPF